MFSRYSRLYLFTVAATVFSVIILAEFLVLPQTTFAEPIVTSTRDGKRIRDEVDLYYHDKRFGYAYTGLSDPNISVSYDTIARDPDSGIVYDADQPITVGSRVQFMTMPKLANGVTWYGEAGMISGGNPRNPIKVLWRRNAEPPRNMCEPEYSVNSGGQYSPIFNPGFAGDVQRDRLYGGWSGSEFINYFEIGGISEQGIYGTFIPLSIDPPRITITLSGSGSLELDDEIEHIYTVTRSGTISATVNYGETYGKMYYGYWAFPSFFAEPGNTGGYRCFPYTKPLAVVNRPNPSTVYNWVKTACSIVGRECGAMYDPGRYPTYIVRIPGGTKRLRVTGQEPPCPQGQSRNADGNCVAPPPPANHAPIVQTITGPTTGVANVSYSFTATATDEDGDSIRYEFDWDRDGIVDKMYPMVGAPNEYVPSGTPREADTVWTTGGAKTLQIRAQDNKGLRGEWKTFTITLDAATVNLPPTPPVIQNCPRTVSIGTKTTFKFSATDPESTDLISYDLMWDNGSSIRFRTSMNESSFLGTIYDADAFAPGAEQEISNQWPTPGTHTLTIKAIDLIPKQCDLNLLSLCIQNGRFVQLYTPGQYSAPSSACAITVATPEPAVSTQSATGVTLQQATLNGTVTLNGSSNVTQWFRWGSSISLGEVNSSTKTNPQSSSGGPYNTLVSSNFSPGATYYFQAVAQAAGGTEKYGEILTFRVPGELQVETNPATAISGSSARLNGTVYNDDSPFVTTWFEWGTDRNNLNHETHGRASVGGAISEVLPDQTAVPIPLIPRTKYFFRAVAQSSLPPPITSSGDPIGVADTTDSLRPRLIYLRSDGTSSYPPDRHLMNFGSIAESRLAGDGSNGSNNISITPCENCRPLNTTISVTGPFRYKVYETLNNSTLTPLAPWRTVEDSTGGVYRSGTARYTSSPYQYYAQSIYVQPGLDILPGTHEGSLILESNDTLYPRVTIPLKVVITGEDPIHVTTKQASMVSRWGATLNAGWQTSGPYYPTEFWFKWGISEALGRETTHKMGRMDADYTKFVLDGLSPSTRYYYQAMARDDRGKEVAATNLIMFDTAAATSNFYINNGAATGVSVPIVGAAPDSGGSPSGEMTTVTNANPGLRSPVKGQILEFTTLGPDDPPASTLIVHTRTYLQDPSDRNKIYIYGSVNVPDSDTTVKNFFRWGTDATATGLSHETPKTTTRDSGGGFVATLTGLTPGTYYYQSIAQQGANAYTYPTPDPEIKSFTICSDGLVVARQADCSAARTSASMEVVPMTLNLGTIAVGSDASAMRYGYGNSWNNIFRISASCTDGQTCDPLTWTATITSGPYTFKTGSAGTISVDSKTVNGTTPISVVPRDSTGRELPVLNRPPYDDASYLAVVPNTTGPARSLPGTVTITSNARTNGTQIVALTLCLGSCSAPPPVSTIDIGLRYTDGTKVYAIAADAPGFAPNSPLRVTSGTKVYSIPLVSVSDPDVTPMRIHTGEGVKALKRYTRTVTSWSSNTANLESSVGKIEFDDSSLFRLLLAPFLRLFQ